MTKVRSMYHDDQDDIFWNSKQELKKAQSVREKNKSMKSSTIRRGIDDYFERSKLRRNIANGYDDFDDDDDFFDDNDDFDHTRTH